MSLLRMFVGVAERYDLLNRMLTLGLDQRWRRSAAKECAPDGERVILDLCCGTGDLAFQIVEYSQDLLVIALDFCTPMVKRAAEKRRRMRRGRSVNLIIGDAAYLPIKDECIGIIGISFSFRNLVYKNPMAEDYLKEVLRVLRPSGKFVIVETSQPRSCLVRTIYHFYARRVIPLLGGLVSGRKGAYRYLGSSVANFPRREEITQMLSHAGFSSVMFRALSLGIVGVHLAVK